MQKKIQSLLGSVLVAWAFVAWIAIVRTNARVRPGAAPAQSQRDEAPVTVDADNIGGVVTSANGPEAGVWVIAETTDFQTKFRKIVVTDDRGRYLIPDLPKANYKIWVRGYGLVDSNPVDAAPGKPLSLRAVVAPSPQAAAQYYPPNYWYSMLKIPPKDAFPMTLPGEGPLVEPLECQRPSVEPCQRKPTGFGGCGGGARSAIRWATKRPA